jgi:hypothetical protein
VGLALSLFAITLLRKPGSNTVATTG